MHDDTPWKHSETTWTGQETAPSWARDLLRQRSIAAHAAVPTVTRKVSLDAVNAELAAIPTKAAASTWTPKTHDAPTPDAVGKAPPARGKTYSSEDSDPNARSVWFSSGGKWVLARVKSSHPSKSKNKGQRGKTVYVLSYDGKVAKRSAVYDEKPDFAPGAAPGDAPGAKR